MNSRKNPARLFTNAKSSPGDRQVSITALKRGMSVRTSDGTIRTAFAVGDEYKGKVRVSFTNDTFTGTSFKASHIFYVCN